MTMTMSIHRVSHVSSGAVSYSNANAITLYITDSDGDKFEITLFGLSCESADHLSRAINGKPPLDESAIRADERQRVIADVLAFGAVS